MYIPIFSLLKSLEKLIYKTVLSFLNKHNVLNDAQNGFRDNKSIYMAKQIFIEDLQRVMDNRLLVMGIFFNLTKDYDVINHNSYLQNWIIMV
jgi:hypothetical protein